MSDYEKVDYSDYIKHLSNMGSMFAFLCGFMFTAITLVITRLSDPSAVMAQFVLFFMGVMLNIFIFYMGSFYMQVVALCKNVPSYSGRKSLFNIFSDVSVMLGLGGSKKRVLKSAISLRGALKFSLSALKKWRVEMRKGVK